MTEHAALSRRSFLCVSAAVVGGAWLPSVASAQGGARITTTDLGGATLLQGAGCNVVAIAGADGALVIDGGLAANADVLLAAVKNATNATRINTLINTHWHPEQVGANEAVGRSGGVIIAHEKTKQCLSNTVYSVTFTGRRLPLPEAARPTKTVRADGSMQVAGQQIDYGYMPAAHTDGDLYIHLPNMNLLVVGNRGPGWSADAPFGLAGKDCVSHALCLVVVMGYAGLPAWCWLGGRPGACQTNRRDIESAGRRIRR